VPSASFHLASSAAALVAPTTAGFVWQRSGPTATFLLGAGAAALTLALAVGRRQGRSAA
jgi:hypothetical protein